MKNSLFVGLAAVVVMISGVVGVSSVSTNAGPHTVTLDRQSPAVVSAGREVVEYELTVNNVTDVDDVQMVTLVVNRMDAQNRRGLFRWTPARGFVSTGGPTYGAQHVNMISGARDWVYYPATNEMVFYFRWETNTTYETIIENRVEHAVVTSQGSQPMVGSTTDDQYTFRVDAAGATPIIDVQLNEYNLELGSSDEQQIDVIFDNVMDASTVNFAQVVLNHAGARSGNPARGLFRYDAGVGFRSLGGATYAQDATNLLSDASDVAHIDSDFDGINDRVVVSFRFTTNDSFGAMNGVSVSYWAVTDYYNHGTLEVEEERFNVVAPPAAPVSGVTINTGSTEEITVGGITFTPAQ